MTLFVARALIALAGGPDMPALALSLTMVALLLASKRAFHRQPGPRDDDTALYAAFIITMIGVTWIALVADPSEASRAAAVRGAGVITALALAGAVVAQHARRLRRERSQHPR